jgi:geranylgeranyl diphosphate synthase type I
MRLIDAGGKRLRPLFCYWGYRAAGGTDGGEPGEPILKASAAFELLHSMALIHDDVIDGSAERRGQPSVHVHQAEAAALRGDPDPEAMGRATAIVAGDLAAVLADRLMLEAGFPPDRLAAGLDRYHRMRVSMAAGQHLSLRPGEADARLVASLKGGAYTVVGPLHVGAALAGVGEDVHASLEAVGTPLGEAFQLLDDISDGEAPPGTVATVEGLVDVSARALASAGFAPEATEAIAWLIEVVGS